MDTEAMDSHLDASYGTTRAAHRPSSHELALFYGNPADGGTELTSDGGYARVTIDEADWQAASGGEKSPGFVTFPAPTDAWSDEATHWALLYGADVLDDWGPLADTLEVTGAGPGPLVEPVVRFALSIVPEED